KKEGFFGSRPKHDVRPTLRRSQRELVDEAIAQLDEQSKEALRERYEAILARREEVVPILAGYWPVEAAQEAMRRAMPRVHRQEVDLVLEEVKNQALSLYCPPYIRSLELPFDPKTATPKEMGIDVTPDFALDTRGYTQMLREAVAR